MILFKLLLLFELLLLPMIAFTDTSTFKPPSEPPPIPDEQLTPLEAPLEAPPEDLPETPPEDLPEDLPEVPPEASLEASSETPLEDPLSPERVEPTSRYLPRGTFRITAYCLRGEMRTGVYTRHGAVAVDPRVIPLWSTLQIDGFEGDFEALDTGGGVKGKWIDIWMPTCNQAINFGMQYRDVTVLSE